MCEKKTDKEKMIDTEIVKNTDNRCIITRLNKVAGQIEGVKRMIDDNRYFLETIIQLRAIRSSLRSIENTMLKGIIASLLSRTSLPDDEIIKKLEEARIILNDKC